MKEDKMKNSVQTVTFTNDNYHTEITFIHIDKERVYARPTRASFMRLMSILCQYTQQTVLYPTLVIFYRVK